MTINVVHGGLIRMSFPVDASSADFTAGALLELTAAGTVRAFQDTSATSVKGLALEAKPSTAATSATSKLGVPSGSQVSMLLDIAIVETDATSSGITFSPNDTVYPCATGDITDANSVNHVLGKALAQKAWTDKALILLDVQY